MGAAAYISAEAIVGSNVTIHAGAWIGPGVTICSGSTISPNCVLGLADPDSPSHRLTVGEDVWVGPGVCVEPGAHIEKGASIGFGCLIRANSRVGRRTRLAQRVSVMVGATLEEDVEILADVYICEDAVLRSHCQIMPGVKLLNDPYPPTKLHVRAPTIEKCAVIGVNAIIWPGVSVGYHAIVASASEVKQNVPEYRLVSGTPAKDICDVRKIRMKLGDRWIFPYPWMRHHLAGDDVTRPYQAEDAK